MTMQLRFRGPPPSRPTPRGEASSPFVRKGVSPMLNTATAVGFLLPTREIMMARGTPLSLQAWSCAERFGGSPTGRGQRDCAPPGIMLR